ncbi:MAG TPA: efflux RND transporter periplasmic adaptor subunit [Gemmataceae bacterium]|jgi:Cu(I)/Ag(I) efflux system membrane fusion protein
MSEPNAFPRPSSGDDEGGLRAPPELGPLGKAWWWFHFVILVKLARLRFIAVLIAVGAVIAYWDTLSAYYEKWTRPLLGQETAANADIEYWCPMHPNIVRDHPDKCPLCAMPLSKRKKQDEKQEDEALPPGIVSRVQLSPYKVAVAGIETVEVGYRKLTKEIATVGFVEFDERKLARITARATGKSRIEKLHVNVTGQMVAKGEPLAELYSPDLVVTVQNLLDARRGGNAALERMARDRLRLWGIDDKQIARIVQKGEPVTHLTIRSPIAGHVITKYQVEGEYVEEGARLYDVADLSTVWIEAQVYEDEIGFLQEGEAVTAVAKSFPNRQFTGKLAFIHPHLDTNTRTLRVRFDMDNPQHALRPGMYATVRLEVPVNRLDLLPSEAETKPKDAPKEGQVLAVPERAVIDTGNHKYVYREAEPDIFEGVEVELGPRCSDFYPVVRGLRAGERVVTTGSFLIDAETRLTAGAASTYFGASGGVQSEHPTSATAARPSMTRDEGAKVQANLAKLGAEDRRSAEQQGVCPVLGGRLGAMGRPVSVVLDGQKVFLCCKACVKDAKANPKAMLAKLAELKARGKSGEPKPAPAPAPSSTASPSGSDPAEEAEIRANLAKLKAADRRLAEEQRFCPVQPDTRLGEMGVPVILEIKDRKVFLCCKNCKKDALKDVDQTLIQVEKLKAKTRSRK